MSLSYVSDSAGNTIAVQIPIEEWNQLKKDLPNVAATENDLPQWQKDLIDKRLKAISEDPGRLHPISGLYEVLENDTEG